MAKKSSIFHNTVKKFTVFLLSCESEEDGRVGYIGKTTSDDLGAVIRRHLRGEVSWTEYDFAKKSLEEVDVIPLEYIECTEAKAYQHLLCWFRLLDGHGGLMLLNPEGTERQAYDMKEDTERIYRSICKMTTAEDVLNGKFSPTPVSSEKPSAPSALTREMTQMNIRVLEDDKNAFYRLCKANSMTQREGFMHLLTLSPLLSDEAKRSATDHLLDEKTKTIARQQKTIQELERKLQQKYRGMSADDKLKQALHNTNQLVKRFVSLVAPHPIKKAMRCLSFNEWSNCGGNFKAYPYPDAAGYAVISMDSISYGRGAVPAVFLYGKDTVTGKQIKLRYYSTRYTIGYSPKNEYACPDSLWLVGYAPASDGAMDINFLLPLPGRWELVPPPATVEHKDRLLDEILAEIKLNK